MVSYIRGWHAGLTEMFHKRYLRYDTVGRGKNMQILSMVDRVALCADK